MHRAAESIQAAAFQMPWPLIHPSNEIVLRYQTVARFRLSRDLISVVQMCKFLLESGADPNIADKDGKTSMHHAMPLGFTGCVRRLSSFTSFHNYSVCRYVAALRRSNDLRTPRRSCPSTTTAPTTL